MENNKIDICFICNGHDFVINMSITIISLLKNSDNDHIFHFHIITDYISQDDKKNLYLLMEIKKFYITFYDIPQSIKDKYINYMNSSRIEIPNWWGYSVFLKLEIHNILFNLDKVLLLDTDIIIMKPIHKLLNIDISNYCLITADFEIYIYSYVREHEHHFISVGELPYFGDLSFYEYYSNLIKKLEINDKQPQEWINAGVMYLNIKLLKFYLTEENIRNSFNLCNIKNIYCTEENIYNLLIPNEKIKRLNRNYNHIAGIWIDDKYTDNIKIVHCTCGKIFPPISHFIPKVKNKILKEGWKYLTMTPWFKENPNYFLDIYSNYDTHYINKELEYYKKNYDKILGNYQNLINKLVWIIPIKNIRNKIRNKLINIIIN